eukprot:5100538-Karenia_brevis.AAC.1
MCTGSTFLPMTDKQHFLKMHTNASGTIINCVATHRNPIIQARNTPDIEAPVRIELEQQH